MQSRPFTHFERMIDLTDRQHPLNAVILLHLEPAPDHTAIQNALSALQQSHPMLRARIQPGDGGRFVFDVTDAVPFNMITGSPESEWQHLAQHLLNTRLDSRRGPLLRVDLLIAPDQSAAALAFTFNHSIVDARSAAVLLHEFIQQVEHRKTAPITQPMPHIEAAFPKRYRGFRKALFLAGFMARQTAQEIAYLFNTIRHPPLPVQPEGACRITYLELTREETHQLTRAARDSGVTLNTLLNAALGLACNRVLFRNDTRLLRMITFADLRPYLTPPLPPSIPGNAISMLRITERVEEGEELLDFAKKIHPSFVEGFRRGDKFAASLMADRMVQMIIRLNRVRLGTTAMSYTGAVNLPESIGRSRITGIHASISNNRFGPILSAQARLFRERLGMDLLYIDSDLTPDMMDKIKAELHRTLTTLR